VILRVESTTMPLYEYRCSGCGHQQEFLQKWSDEPLTVCTACGQPSFQKMLTAAGFQLKGSGWYATDFKNSGAKSPAKADTKPDAKVEAKGEGQGRGEERRQGRRRGRRVQGQRFRRRCRLLLTHP
jgi:putative FmdB family regulatory protein